MLRFIDLRGQIDIYDDKPLEEQRIDFAFFDTIHEKFIEINGSQRWTRFEDLAMDINIGTRGALFIEKPIGSKVDPLYLPGELERAYADIDTILAEVERLNEMVPGRWWRVTKPDGSLWCETSDEEEARASSTETGWPLERLFVSQRSEWRPA